MLLYNEKEDKMTEIIIREAQSNDAQQLIDFLNLVGRESHFLTLDEAGILMTSEQMMLYLSQIQEKDNNTYLLAFLDGEIVGVCSVTADFHERIRHIGELFIAVGKKYQGYGIGRLLMTDLLSDIQEAGVIKRLELQVQKRNEKAVLLYEKFGFQLESTRKYGARDEGGELIDVLEMVRFFE